MDEQSSIPATPEPQTIPGLIEGRIVHYVLPEGLHRGAHRPAIIVKVWSHETGCANLTVFPDWDNDAHDVPTPGPFSSGLLWATSHVYSEKCEPGTWHFIERA